MKSTLAFLACLLCGTLLFAAEKKAGRCSRAETLAQIKSAFGRSKVVLVAKTEMRGGKRVFVCSETLKASEGLPAAGETIPLDATLPIGREGLLFMASYPLAAFSGELRWIEDGKLRECPDLSLADIKAELLNQPAKPAEVAR